MASVRSIRKAIERRTNPKAAARQEIRDCSAAWDEMMKRMDVVVGWVRQNCTPQEVAIYERWASVNGEISDDERKIFRTINPPKALTDQAQAAILAFNSYPKQIKGAVVATRKAFNAL